ncbi:hypothetical protein AB0910_28220 [Streptomyces sp. NPDC047002]|uniref:hypothetical protein n=1 Tax=Streptomyces sp. NPDC047002 TaxID=3155475 RepID=UPI00345427C0
MPESPERYVARVVDVPDTGIRLAPAAGTAAPAEPTEANLLGMAVALALGAAGYAHRPAPREAAQTVAALLAGEAAMPWRATAPTATGARETVPYVVCERPPGGHYACALQHRPPGDEPPAGD